MKILNDAVTKRHTKLAISKLQTAFENRGIDTECIQVIKDAIYIAPKRPELLSEELVAEIKDIFFWTDCILVEDIESLVRIDDCSNSLLINLTNFEEIASVREKLISYGTIIQSLSYEQEGFSYNYSLNGTPPLNFDKLEEVRSIVNPKRDNPRSTIVHAYHGIYSIRLHT